MKIGILGSGNVGKALVKGFLQFGYTTTISSRSQETQEKLAKEIDGVLVANFETAAKNADIIVLAVKGDAALEALKLAGIENLTGKTIIDATNPISNQPPVNGVLQFFTTINHSLMEQLQAEVPNANFVKAFSCVGNGFMVNPPFATKPTMFICGNDAQAKLQVTQILQQFNWEVEDCGAVEAARAIEPLCMLWCIPGFLNNQWTHAFKLLKL